MKTSINNPIQSKINITALVQNIIGIIVLWEFFSPEFNEKLAGSALMLGGILTFIFRTWFTNNLAKPGEHVTTLQDGIYITEEVPHPHDEEDPSIR